MLTIDLASLKAQELARLLDVARQRGEDELVRILNAELALRRGGQEFREEAPAPAAPEPPATVSFVQPAPVRKRRRKASTPWGSLAVAASATVVVAGAAGALGWFWVRPPVTPAKAAAPTVALTALPAASNASTVRVAEARAANRCLSLPTPGERLICGYPSLAIRQHKLEAALSRARAVAPDPTAFEAAQDAWMRDRDSSRDRQTLAALYDARIGELESATVITVTTPGEPPS